MKTMIFLILLFAEKISISNVADAADRVVESSTSVESIDPYTSRMYYCLVGVFCLAICVISLVLALRSHKAIVANPTEKWSVRTAYLKWGFLGFLGAHRFYLNSWFGLLYPVILSVFIFLLARDLLPCFWGIHTFAMSYISVLSWSVLRVFLGLWFFDAFWIRYRCYAQPYLILRGIEKDYIRTNKKDEVIIESKDGWKFTIFSKRIYSVLNRLDTRVAQRYDGTRNGFFRGFGNLFRSKDPWLEFEEKKFEEIVNLYEEATSISEEYFSHLAAVKTKYMKRILRSYVRNLAIIEALLIAMEYKQSNESVDDITVRSEDHTRLFPEAIDPFQMQPAGIDEWVPLQSMEETSPEKMERIVDYEGQKAIKQTLLLAEIIKTPYKEKVKDLLDLLSRDREFWTGYYIPLRNELFMCKPTFWNFLTHKQNDLGAFVRLCNPDVTKIVLPTVKGNITPKAQKLAEDMKNFGLEYTDTVISILGAL